MYAIIRTGGKQYRVAKDDVIAVEKLDGEAGDAITFQEVLLVGGETVTVGQPTVAGAAVTGEVVAQTRSAKVLILKKRRRKNYRRRGGHRQQLTQVRITGIEASA